MRAGARGAGDGAVDRYHCASRSARRSRTRASTPNPFATTSSAIALKRAESRYRPEIIENNTRRQIEVCTRGVLCQPPRLGHAGARSDLHRRPAALGLDAARADPGLALAGRGHAGAAQHPADRARDCAAATRIGANPRYPRHPRRDECRGIRRARRAVPRLPPGSTAPASRIFIDKMPNNFRHLGLIHLMLPNARIIDARREPMACCFSNLKQLFAKARNSPTASRTSRATTAPTSN